MADPVEVEALCAVIGALQVPNAVQSLQLDAVKGDTAAASVALRYDAPLDHFVVVVSVPTAM